MSENARKKREPADKHAESLLVDTQGPRRECGLTRERAEDRKHGLPRVGHLQAAYASVRFISVKPLLEDIGELDLGGIYWVIVGGESPNRARSFDVAWARSVLRQCREQRVACFVKQLRSRPVSVQTRMKLRSYQGGNWDEWPPDLRVHQYPSV